MVEVAVVAATMTISFSLADTYSRLSHNPCLKITFHHTDYAMSKHSLGFFLGSGLGGDDVL